jgi:trans-2,3-dihydro-3-hydroxyanthranilate isomerase
MVGLRARGIDSLGEDPATGSASGCTVSWLIRYGQQESAEMHGLIIASGAEAEQPWAS